MILHIQEAISRWDRQQLLFGILAVCLGLLASSLIAFSSIALLPFAVVGALLIFWVLLKYPETLGLPLLVFITYTRFSDVIEHFHGVPSFLLPLALLMLGILLIRWRFFGEPVPHWERTAILIGTYGFIGFTSLLYAADPSRSWLALYEYAKNASLLLVVVLLLRRPHTFHYVVWALLAAGIFLGSITVYQQLTGTFENDYWGFAQTQVKNIVGRTRDYRVGGALGAPNFYAMILIVLVPLALDRFWNAQKWILRLLAAWALTVCTLATIFTFSRGGFLGLCFVLLIMFLRRPPRPATLLVSLVVLMGILQFVPANYTPRLSTIRYLLPASGEDARTDNSFRGRTSEGTVAWQMFMDHPILGVGLSNYNYFYQEYSRPLGLDDRRQERSAHNLYLEIAAETGLIGLMVFGAIIWSAIQGMRRTHQLLVATDREDIANMVWAFLVGLSGYLATSLFLHGSFARYLWLLLGIALALPQIVEQPAKLMLQSAMTKHALPSQEAKL